MVIGSLKVAIYIPWAHSLKEKRMIVKSICAKARNKFNISIAEIADQDIHQKIILGIVCVAGDNAHGDSILDHVINFIESNTEGEIMNIERELLTP